MFEDLNFEYFEELSINFYEILKVFLISNKVNSFYPAHFLKSAFSRTQSKIKNHRSAKSNFLSHPK